MSSRNLAGIQLQREIERGTGKGFGSPIGGVTWRDIDSRIKPTRIGDTVSVEDVAAVKRNLGALLSLEKHDKPFHPEIHAGLTTMVFDNWSPQVSKVTRDKVANLIDQFETRVDLISVSVDWEPRDSELTITITFKMNTDDREYEYVKILRRTR